MIKQNNKKNIQSSGNLFLDNIIGGLSIGSIVLLIEDHPTAIADLLLKYFIAEGLVNKQRTFLYASNLNRINQLIAQLPYKSTQVDAILNAKRVNETKSNTNEMKIAWRYENIKYSNVLEEIAKQAEYIFDLSRELQDMHLQDKERILTKTHLTSMSALDLLDEFNTKITNDYQEYACGFSEEEDAKYSRIVFPSVLDDFPIEASEEFLRMLKIRLITTKNLARSINGVFYLTIKREFLDERVCSLLQYFSDYVFSVKSFMMDQNKLQDYDGLFNILKLPKLCSMKCLDMDTDVYGVIVEKRKLIIEKIDIGVEVDRNTKVKESDISASQAMCGPEKYSKNYEF